MEKRFASITELGEYLKIKGQLKVKPLIFSLYLGSLLSI